MRRNEQGFVLVVVMWVVAVLTVVVLSLGSRALLDRRSAAYSLDQVQTQNLARGAVARGIVELRNKLFYDALDDKEGYTGFDQHWAKSLDLFQEEPQFELGGETEVEGDLCRFQISDEDSRISLNFAPKEILEELEGVSFKTVSEILDRRATLSEAPPMMFLSIDEVRGLDGVTDKLWEGTKDRPGLKSLFTVWGDAKINVNTASREVLQCIPDLDDATVELLIAARPFPALERIQDKAQLSPNAIEALQRYCKADSSFFTITGFATQRQGAVAGRSQATMRLTPDGAEILEWRESPIGQ